MFFIFLNNDEMNYNKMKVIISTGQGRLHLIQSAIALKNIGIQIEVITGWIPSKLFSENLINLIGMFVGRRGNLSEGLKKRSPKEIDRNDLKSCWKSEFIIHMLFTTASIKMFSRSTAAIMGWKLFGRESKKFINNADVFHVRSGAGQGGAIAKARSLGMKIVIDHSIAHPYEMQRQLAKAYESTLIVQDKHKTLQPEDNFWNLVLQDCLEADLLLVNSDYVKWSFEKEGYPSEKIKVAQLGVNPEFNQVKQDYKINDTIRLVFTGGFGIRKGASLIIDALTQLKEKQFLFTIDVIGSIMSDIFIPDWMIKSENIRFHGHLSQDKMLPILLNSDIYIFPTYVEGAAQSVKEAMAVGLPVITTFQSGAPITHKENGWLIQDHSSEDLADAIIKLANDCDKLEYIGRNASSTIEKGHTWPLYASTVSDIYNNCCNHTYYDPI